MTCIHFFGFISAKISHFQIQKKIDKKMIFFHFFGLASTKCMKLI